MFPKPEKRSKKPPKRVKGRSNKGMARNKLYKHFVRPAYLAGLAAGQGRKGKKAVCERCGAPANQVHHLAGREGAALHDPLNLALLCNPCHDYCHDRPEAAMAEGWVKSRHRYHQERQKKRLDASAEALAAD